LAGPSHTKRITDTPVLVSEQAIERYGAKAIALYAYVGIRCINSAVYPWDEANVRDRFGWGRSKFFKAMNALVKAGLAHKQDCGHWMLANRKKVAGTQHKAHLLITRKHTERDVLDATLLKLVEMGHRQVAGAILPKERKGRIRANRIKLLEEKERTRYNPKMISAPALIGEEQADLVKRVQTGYAPMNTEKLMRHTGLGRVALFAWKKRVKRNGWIDQVDRRWRVPPKVATGLPDHADSIERDCRGRVSTSRSQSCYYFHQASCYKLLLPYGK
jgi:hypothetical protein